MRFPLLKPGQKFIYQEKRYTKTGPMTASEEESGKSCMIRRSAEVTLLQGHDERQQDIPQQFTRDQVVTLLKAYQRELKTGLAEHPAEVLKVVEDCDVMTFLSQIDRSGIS